MRLLLGGLMILANSVYAAILPPIIVNVGTNPANINVMLPTNPTTGFQWTVKDYNRNLLKLVSSKYQKPDSKMPGAGGRMYYVFQLLKTPAIAQTSLDFVYSRPWDLTKSDTQSVTINFN